MRKFHISSAAATVLVPMSMGFISLGQTAVADDIKNARHQVSGPVSECLIAPTRACALKASMTTAIEEKLSIERAKVLTAIGRALAETGQFIDARLTLNMAFEEAKNSKISFAVDAKVVEMAPIYALMGDADKAIELALAIQSSNTRNMVLSRSADMAAKGGNIASARKISEALDSRDRAVWVALSAMKTAVFGGHKDGLKEYADSILPDIEAMNRPSNKLLAMVRISMVYAAVGDVDKSNQFQEKISDNVKSLVSYSMKARVASGQLEYASVSVNAGDKEIALRAALDAESLIRGAMEKSSITDEMGPALAFAGHAEIAAGYAKYYNEILEKSNYLKRVTQFYSPTTNEEMANVIQSVLEDSLKMENGFEADEVRMNLLFAARATANLELSKKIALSMQDDDNAARALALLIPLL